MVAVAVVSVYLTGEPAEEVVEHVPGVAERRIEDHEEFALAALVAAEVLGAVTLAGLVRFGRGRPHPAWLMRTMLALGLVAVALLARTANLGGHIRHTEIHGKAEAKRGAEQERKRSEKERGRKSRRAGAKESRP